MKSLACRDAGIDCDWTATAESEDELIKKAAEHGRTAHGMKDIPPEMVEKIRSKIRDVKAA